MKNLIRAYETARDLANKADAAWENEPDNEELEKAFDEAYSKEFETLENLVKAIVKITNNEIDEKTARLMIATKFETLKQLLENA